MTFFPTGRVSAIFALGLNSGAYQCETIRGAISAIPSGQMEAGRSIGLNYMQTMRLIIMPQAIRICIPPMGNGQFSPQLVLGNGNWILRIDKKS